MRKVTENSMWADLGPAQLSLYFSFMFLLIKVGTCSALHLIKIYGHQSPPPSPWISFSVNLEPHIPSAFFVPTSMLFLCLDFKSICRWLMLDLAQSLGAILIIRNIFFEQFLKRALVSSPKVFVHYDKCMLGKGWDCFSQEI